MTYNWNGSARNAGPLISASDGDTLTIMLVSNDSITHSWFIDLNDNFQLDSDELGTRSPDFNSNITATTFTFTATLGVIPHGGVFTYRCQQHPGPMFGDFKFYAGPVASFTYTPSLPLAGHPAFFDGTSSWPSTDRTIASYRWNFGDGNTTTTSGSTVTHTYLTARNYTAILNVTDSSGQNATETKQLTVKNPSQAPFNYTMSITPNSTTLTQGESAAAVLRLSVVSGTPENVTLTFTVSPADPTIQGILNTTSGFPPYTASISIRTTISTPPGTYAIAVKGLGGNVVAHNATFILTITTKTPTGPQTPNYAFITAVGATVILALMILYRAQKRSRVQDRALLSN